MATKKSTTRGKTKTTTAKNHTAAAKTAKPSTKSVKKPVTKKATVKVSNAAVKRSSLLARLRRNKSTAKTVDTVGRLQRLHTFSALVFIVLAVAAGTIMKTTTYSLSLGHMGRDSLASRTETVYAPAKEPLADLEIRWVLVAILAVATVFSVLYLTRLKAQYADSLKTKVFKWRWIELAITGALSIELLAVLSGVEDIAALKLIGGFVIVTCILKWIIERDAAAGRVNQAAFNTSILTGLLPWVLIAIYGLATYVYGGIRLSWYVYAAYAATFVGMALIGRNVRRSMTGMEKDYSTTEYSYSVVSLLMKAALAVVLIIGFKR